MSSKIKTRELRLPAILRPAYDKVIGKVGGVVAKKRIRVHCGICHEIKYHSLNSGVTRVASVIACELCRHMYQKARRTKTQVICEATVKGSCYKSHVFTVNNCKACWLLTILNNCPHPLDVFSEISSYICQDLKSLIAPTPLLPEQLSNEDFGFLGFEYKENNIWIDVKLTPSENSSRNINDFAWDDNSYGQSSRESSTESTLEGFLPNGDSGNLLKMNETTLNSKSVDSNSEVENGENKDEDIAKKLENVEPCIDSSGSITKIDKDDDIAKKLANVEPGIGSIDSITKIESSASAEQKNKGDPCEKDTKDSPTVESEIKKEEVCPKIETKSTEILLAEKLEINGNHDPTEIPDNKDLCKPRLDEFEEILTGVSIKDDKMGKEFESFKEVIDIDEENEPSIPPETDEASVEIDDEIKYDIPVSLRVSKHLEEESIDDPGTLESTVIEQVSTTGRSRRKQRVEYYTKPKAPPQQRKGKGKGTLYGPDGRIQKTGKDLCDCLISECPGCHFPCPKCRSPKCGNDCRVNRRWYYEKVEVEGTKICFFNRFVPKI